MLGSLRGRPEACKWSFRLSSTSLQQTAPCFSEFQMWSCPQPHWNSHLYSQGMITQADHTRMAVGALKEAAFIVIHFLYSSQT